MLPEPVQHDVVHLLAALRAGEPKARERLAEYLYPRVRESVHRMLATDFRNSHEWILAAFSTGDIDLTYIDAQVSVAIQFLKVVEARVGYRYIRFDGTVDDFFADATLDGFFVAVGVNF